MARIVEGVEAYRAQDGTALGGDQGLGGAKMLVA